MLAADSTERVDSFFEMIQHFSDCQLEISRNILGVGAQPDWLQIIRGWVAEWDTEFFEAHR